jgi:hypothetical protein
MKGLHYKMTILLVLQSAISKENKITIFLKKKNKMAI